MEDAAPTPAPALSNATLKAAATIESSDDEGADAIVLTDVSVRSVAPAAPAAPPVVQQLKNNDEDSGESFDPRAASAFLREETQAQVSAAPSPSLSIELTAQTIEPTREMSRQSPSKIRYRNPEAQKSARVATLTQRPVKMAPVELTEDEKARVKDGLEVVGDVPSGIDYVSSIHTVRGSNSAPCIEAQPIVMRFLTASCLWSPALCSITMLPSSSDLLNLPFDLPFDLPSDFQCPWCTNASGFDTLGPHQAQ